jgi:putative oxidoreductase
MLNRPLPAPARDIAILIGRVILGVVLFAHGWQKLMINGIAGTYGQFEKMGIPLAIVSASFASFVEFVGGVLIILGALTSVVVALDLVVMVGAAGFVHFTHGIFAQDGGWELVGVIVAAELALAAYGPGRFSVDHLITHLRQREHDVLRERMQKPVRIPAPVSETFTPAVATSAAPSYPTGGFASVDEFGDAAVRTESFPVIPAVGAPALTVADVVGGSPSGRFSAVPTAETSTGVFVATTAVPGTAVPATAVPATGGFAAASPAPIPADGLVGTSYASMPTGAIPVVPPAAEPVGMFVPVTPAAPVGSFASGSSADTAAETSDGPDYAAISAAMNSSFASETGNATPVAEPAADAVAATVALPATSGVRAAVDVEPSASVTSRLAAVSPRMASAGVHRAISERAGRQASEEVAPFGVTVQSPLDFTPTTAFPAVPAAPMTEMIAVATPGGLPQRVRHTPDLPRASAVRPYAS